MLCQVCREDLPAAKFHAEQYKLARVNCSNPPCIECTPLNKKQRKMRTAQVLAILEPKGKAAKAAWRNLKPQQKLQVQMEKRTPCELILEKAMASAGLKFKVQHQVGCYWADFYIADGSIVIEVDGTIHNTPTQKEYDARRNRWMGNMGYAVVRFTNEQVKTDISGVLAKIESTVKAWRGVGRQKRKWKPVEQATIYDAPVYVPPNQLVR